MYARKFSFRCFSIKFIPVKKIVVFLNLIFVFCMSNENEKTIQDSRLKNEIDKAIRLIKSNSGFGNIVINIYEGKAINIKATLSTDLR